MARLGKLVGIGLLAAAMFSVGTSAASAVETVRMGGTGAATAMLAQLFDAFGGAEKGIELQVVPSLGSSGALRALDDGALDLAVSGRALTSQERGMGLTQRLAIRTPYVLITSHPDPGIIKSIDVAELYKSPKAAWGDGSGIRLILRPKSDSDSAVLAGMFPGMADAIEQARQRPDVPIAATDQDNADLAERAPSTLAGSTFTQVKTERRNLRLVAIDGVEPSLENLESGDYPYEKTLYFVLSLKKSAAVEDFLAFLNSPAGHAALRAAGNLPAAD